MAMNSNGSTNISFQKINSGIIFLIIATVYIVCNLIWWQINTPIIPQKMDALHFFDVFQTGNFYYNAPLVTWIMKGMFFLFGTKNFDLQVIVVNYIFFLIPLYFIYKIGKEIDSKETGNIAMILFALTPAIYAMTRQYGHQDYHLVAGITFNIYCLIKTDYFTNKKWSAIYGISVGLGLLIKDAFLAYFFIPWVYIVMQSLKENFTKSKIINIFMTILLASLIAAPHYFRTEIIKKIVYEPVTEPVSLLNFKNMSALTTGLWENLLSPPIFIIFIVAFVWFLIKYRNRYKIIFLLWFLIPLGIIILMPHQKLSEYGLGVIPAIVIINAIYVSNIKKYLIKKFLIAFICIIGICQFLIFSYFHNSILTETRIQFKNAKIHYYKNTFIYYNSDNTKNNMLLISKLETEYPNYRIGLFCNINYDPFAVKFIIASKGKKNIKMFYDLSGFSRAKKNLDYIIFAGQDMSLDDMISFCMQNYDVAPALQQIDKNKFFNNIKDTAKTLDAIIKNNFELVKIWYPNNVQDENFKVKIFKKIKNTDAIKIDYSERINNK